MTAASSSTPARPWFERFWFRHLLLALVVSLFAAGLSRLTLFQRFENATFDRRLASRPPRPAGAAISIFELDDKALDAYGRWPWPRSRVGELVETLDRAGARLVLLDVEFPEPSQPTLQVPAGEGPEAPVRALREAFARLSPGSLAATEPEPAAPRAAPVVAGEDLASVERRLVSLEKAIVDQDRLLAASLRRSGKVHGLGHAEFGASRADRARQALLSRFEAVLAANPSAGFDELPQTDRWHPSAAALFVEARLALLLSTSAGLSAPEAAGRLSLPLSDVNPVLETVRTRVLREALMRSAAASPGATRGAVLADAAATVGLAGDGASRHRLDELLPSALATREVLGRWGLALPRGPGAPRPPGVRGLVPPMLEFVRAFRSVAVANSLPDEDGVVRRVPLLWDVKGRGLPQAGLALALDALGAVPGSLEVAPGPALRARLADGGELLLPVDAEGRVLVDWAGDWQAFTRASVAGLVDLRDLEAAYVEALVALDPTGLAARLQELARSGLPWRSPPRLTRAPDPVPELVPPTLLAGRDHLAGNASLSYSLQSTAYSLIASTAALSAAESEVLSLEAEVLQVAADGVARLQQSVEAHAAGVTPGDSGRQERRTAALRRARSALARALSLREQLGGRSRELDLLARDRLCFVGASAAGLGDLISTPYQEGYPGVGLHANVTNMVVSGRYLRRTTPLQELLLTLALGLASSLLFALASLQASLLLGLALLGTFAYLAFAALALWGLWVPLVAPLAAVAGCCLVLTSLRYFGEARLRAEAERMFGYYLSPEVISRLREDPSRLRRGGEEVELTAFFTDLAGFSTVSEHATPAEVVDIVNDYLGECTEVLMRHEGTLERYEGDAIRAMFGAPIRREDHAAQACLAAVEMERVLALLRARYRAANLPELGMRFGMNSGPAVVGNIGARNRFSFTMMGDAVNLAARLEAVNKVYGTKIVASEETVKQAGGVVEVRELDLVRVVGRKGVVRIFEILCRKGELDPLTASIREVYAAGLAAYREGDWPLAISTFEKAVSLGRADPPSEVLLARCRELVSSPAPGDWDGVFILRTK